MDPEKVLLQMQSGVCSCMELCPGNSSMSSSCMYEQVKAKHASTDRTCRNDLSSGISD